jgi:YVTN family beta-propeller protein
VIVDFEVVRPERTLVEGEVAELRFRLTEQATGDPVRGVTPGAWMDIGEVLAGQPEEEQKSCKDKVGLYLGGAVGIRPMLDLNGYYVLVMNREPSLSVVDPLVSMAGRTSTLTMIPLQAPGSDWVTTQDQLSLFVSMPKAGCVAVVDTEAFEVVAELDAGSAPSRVELQPDGRFLWVGNDAEDPRASGVTVIDTLTMHPVGHIATGLGHHEIAFSDDSRLAFVSNRASGTVSVIDIATRERVGDIDTGPMPISLAWSSHGKTLYVADGQTGNVSMIDAESLAVEERIALTPGLGPLGFTQDGRFALVVNPVSEQVFVLDPATDALVHTLEVPGKPYQLVFSRAFAYVRGLATQRVTLINLASLGSGREPIVQGFDAGAAPPGRAKELPLAETVATASTEAAGFVVSPGDATTYFYMEGMNAPASNYRVYGAAARAVTVVDRSLKEVEPGVYAAKVKIPVAGKYDVAFLLETPELLHCFAVTVQPSPRTQLPAGGLAVEYLEQDHRATLDGPMPFRFRLLDPTTGRPHTGLRDVTVLFFRLPGKDRTEVAAREEDGGVYRAMLPFPRTGAYYVHVGVRSERVGYGDLAYFSVLVTGGAQTQSAKPAGESG